MIYVERFPEECTHEHLAAIFKRAGHRIKHVSIPRYQESKLPKGFAFIEFHTPEDAQNAVDLFDNVVPQEFLDSMSDNFIPVQGAVRALKVMRKADWLKSKEEMSQIKQEIALLNLETMYPTLGAQPEQHSEDKSMKDVK